jgi:type II secretory pathway component GspD/PulD (secretin)
MGIAVGVAISAAPEVAAAPPALAGLALVMGQTSVRPSRVHAALNNGIDCYRRADYDSAAAFFQQAQAGEADLSVDERQELHNLMRFNAAALKARKDGASQLARAEGAISSGRTSEAEAVLKGVTTNQFLTPADKLKAQRLYEGLRGGPTMARTPARNNGVPADVIAKTKLQQARLLMQKANYDAAEALAHEAEQVRGAVYRPGDDTPERVLGDINAQRADAKGLLVKARQAYQAGDLDHAEELAKAAQQAAQGWSFRIWTDTPSKVLRDVRLARERQGVHTASKPMEPGTLTEPQAARELVREGRQALQSGDLERAQHCAGQAQSLNAAFHWWEDDPAKLQRDVQRATERSKRLLTRDKNQKTSLLGPTHSAQAPTSGDPKEALQEARATFDAGKLDEAERAAVRLQSDPNASWGLFEDSPDHLLADLRKARAAHDVEESGRVLAEARKLFNEGKLDAAQSLAYKAERMHGPYSVWDMGDRPAKLLAEISVAQARVRKQGGSALAAAKQTPSPYSVQAPVPPARNLNRTQPNVQLAAATGQAGTGIVQAKATQPQSPTTPGAQPALAKTTAPAGNPARERVMQMLAQARVLQQTGRLVEARQKLLEAQKVGAPLGAEDDRPERALLQLTGIANKKIETLVQEATDYASTGAQDPARFEKAQQDLAAARALASGFALDTQAIDSKSAWVERLREHVHVARAPEPRAEPPQAALAQQAQAALAQQAEAALAQQPQPAPAVAAPKAADVPVGAMTDAGRTGREILDRARAELSRGEVDTARRLAVEVYSGDYGLQAQADAVLHSIDAEEFNQHVLTTNRAFDAALQAYFRKDYTQASSMLHALDASLLSPEKHAKLKELMMVPELNQRALVQASAPASPPAGQAPASDGMQERSAPQDSFVNQVQAMEEIKFQELRDKGLAAQREATDRFRNGDADQALEILQDYLDGLREAQLEPDRLALLQRPVDARLQQFRTLKAQQAFEKLQSGKHESFDSIQTRTARLEQHKHEEMGELMKQYQAFYKEGKYEEAEMVARRAHEIDPDDVAAAAAVHVAHIQRNQAIYSKIKDGKEEMVLRELDESEDEGPAVTMKNPVELDKEHWKERVAGRKGFPQDGVLVSVKSEKEREIERRLGLPITLDFKDEPLQQVIDDLRDMTGINIVADRPALEEENISLDRPITMHLEGVATKSALNLLLHQAHLIYVIKDEVVQITTEAHARGKLVQKTYSVADLIVPVDDHTLPNYANFARQMDMAGGQQNPGLSTPTATPVVGPKGLSNGTPVGTLASQAADVNAPKVAPGQTLEATLIKLITNTVHPETWSDMGGPGTIDYYPLGMALVISQTPDIQEQVADLLQALRRLQDLEVTVEVRFITIAESFFERIGLDFSFNIVTDNTKYEPQLITQQFKPFGFNNNFAPQSLILGLEPTPFTPGHTAPLAPAPDLNIPVSPSGTSFAAALPPFGGYPNTPGFSDPGAFSLGLAFLSDIQVFLFLEAAQGDRRTNVMQAPKLTMFNGQTATINVADSQFFVTAINAFSVNGNIVIQPVNQQIALGVFLTLQPVVSADRRFVRINLAPTLTNLANNTTALFPITFIVTPTLENGTNGLSFPVTQYIQQPTVNTVTVQTTVNIPDGGTVLLGGLKKLSEGRNEFGPPVFSKIPYLNRLFKNTGYGREAESLLLMVTPRIIINEEEEVRQTGVNAGFGQLSNVTTPTP